MTGMAPAEAAAHGAEPVAVVKVPDDRVDRLAEIYKPKKKIQATIEFSELAGVAAGDGRKTGFSEQFLGKLRTAMRCFWLSEPLETRRFRIRGNPSIRSAIFGTRKRSFS